MFGCGGRRARAFHGVYTYIFIEIHRGRCKIGREPGWRVVGGGQDEEKPKTTPFVMLRMKYPLADIIHRRQVRRSFAHTNTNARLKFPTPSYSTEYSPGNRMKFPSPEFPARRLERMEFQKPFFVIAPLPLPLPLPSPALIKTTFVISVSIINITYVRRGKMRFAVITSSWQ